MQSTPPIRAGRKIQGMSAVLLPMATETEIDWPAFEAHLSRTVDAGLTPALNMDTGYAHLIDRDTQDRVLATAEAYSISTFLAGVAVRDTPGSPFDLAAYCSEAERVQHFGGIPILFQSFGLTEQAPDRIVASYAEIGERIGRFYAFELGEMFAHFGKIYALNTFQELLGIKTCIGAKHSSLSRQAEWDRLRLRDQYRPDFQLLTGNDLAIDMVMYGSDYLLGLSTFAPDEFALRDRLWLAQRPEFYELNDWLQYLGQFAFRHPVPAYKHTASQFLQLRGWSESSYTYPGSPTRPESDVAVLNEIRRRLDTIVHSLDEFRLQ